MQILEIDWQHFLNDLALFQRLPCETRRIFVQMVRPSQPVSASELGEHFEVLCSSGFLLPGVRGVNASVPPRHRTLCRVMRALYRHRLFDFPSRQIFYAYLDCHFTRQERETFYRPGIGYYYYDQEKLYPRVSTPDWLEQFLKAPGETWQERIPSSDERKPASPEILQATKELVRQMMSQPAPIALTELPNLWPQSRLYLLWPALMGGIRNLLLFPALREAELEPVIGIWPSISKRLFRSVLKPPETVRPQQVFEAPFLMDDMGSTLATCAAEPLRLLSQGSGLYVRAEKAIASALAALPDWVEKQFNLQTSARIDWAMTFLKHHELLEAKGEYGKDRRFEVSELGRKWLGLPARERLKVLIDGVSGKLKKRKGYLGYEYDYDKPTLLPYSVRIDEVKEDEVRDALLAAFAGSPVADFVRLQEFLVYHGQRDNPLVKVLQKHPHATFRIRGSYVHTPTPEELDEAWEEILREFLRLRLLPLGAVKVATDEGGALCFSLTEAGRYLVGTQPDFRLEQAPGRIVVQPNFDVVFLAPAPRAEAEISRFAERKGRHMGTLFKITKRSILVAAAAGITAEQVFDTLRQYCPGELPPNVQREISGWFAQCRRVWLRPAVLIQCPDLETAARIKAVVAMNATRITDTILELHDQNAQPTLLRKLRDAGIFVSFAAHDVRDSERAEELEEDLEGAD